MSAALRSLLRQPLTIFLLLGLAVFALQAWRGAGRGDSTIHITDAHVGRIVQLWITQTGRAPSETELRSLIAESVREEVLFREALRLGLDRDDVILRRRLAQKMSFALESREVSEEPSTEELEAYFLEAKDRYRVPAKTTFRHVYLSTDRRSDASADAAPILSQLAEDAAGWRRLGDPFMLQREFAERSESDVAELFGSDFASALFDLGLDGWQGPVASAYGLHLVEVLAHQEAYDPPIDDVRSAVRTDFLAERRRTANEREYQRLRDRYRVVLPEGLQDAEAEAD